MKTLLFTLTMLVTFIAITHSVPFPWVANKPDYLSQRQEQAPARLRCFGCAGPSCPAVQREIACPGAVLNCITLQAFDIVLNTSIAIQGCIIDCTESVCESQNRSRGFTLRLCSISCCNTSLCNAGPVSTIQPPTTTASPPITTTPQSTTTPPPPTTMIPPTTTTAPPTTTKPPRTTTRPPTTTRTPPNTTKPPRTTTSPPTTTKYPPTTTKPPRTTPAITTTTGPTTTLPTTVAATTPFRPGICGGPLAGASGYFASPYYPLNYPNNAYCVWTIIVPPGSVLRIYFLFFKTEECYDFVRIYVGRRSVRYLTGDDVDDDDDDDKHKCDDKDDNDDEKDIGWFFNRDEGLDVKVVTIYGTGEMIRILFSSDASVTKRGFFAKYTVMQGAIFG